MKNSLQQYIDLFHANAATIDAGSTPTLNRRRPEALEALQGARLPDRRTEGYESTSIDDMMAPDMGLNISRLNFQADVARLFRCDLPNMSSLLGIVVNDVWHPTATLLKNLPEGVIFDSISNVSRRNPELVDRYYGSVATLDAPAVALNTLLAQDGVMIYIPRGVKLQRPLQLVNIFNTTAPLLAFRRVIVVVEEDAEARLLVCDHTQGDQAACVASQVIEVTVKRGGRLDYYDMEKSNAVTSRHSMMFIHQEEGSNVLVNTTTLTCGVTRNEVTVNLDGEHAESTLTGMAIATGAQHVDNATLVAHRAPRCHSDQLYKYVLEDDSRGAFEGTIHVHPEAPFTTAYQSNRNIVASSRAKMHTKPQLLIYNDEVKCSHGATTGQLDEEALFYMRSRGIPLDEARNMLMQAFMVDVIDSVRLESLRDRLRHMVERRFAGDADQGACDICNPSSEPCL